MQEEGIPIAVRVAATLKQPIVVVSKTKVTLLSAEIKIKMLPDMVVCIDPIATTIAVVIIIVATSIVISTPQ
jgi:hypothetical protein